MKTTTVVCGKCDGKKTLSWTRIANGVCFQCNGTGVLVVDSVEIAKIKLDRKVVIARVQGIFLKMVQDGVDYVDCPDTLTSLGYLLAHADEDVVARARARYTAIANQHGLSAKVQDWAGFILNRSITDETANLAARVQTKIVNVRRVAS